MAESGIRTNIDDLGRKLRIYSQAGARDNVKMLKLLKKLEKFPMNLSLLRETHIGITVNKLRKECKNIQIELLAKALIKKWKKLVPVDKKPIKKQHYSHEGEPSTSSHHDFYDCDNPIREKSLKLLRESLSCEDSSINIIQLAMKIERCIYEEIKDSGNKYRNRIRSRIVNLRDEQNPKLKENVLSGVISPEKFASMTNDEMASDEVKKLKEEMLRQSILEAQVPKVNLSSSNLFKCSRCGERDTSYNQVQTLSGDEPMTTFVVCNKCGKRWKFN